eukprot:5270886-Pleurochrysis_carterae.AAC.1
MELELGVYMGACAGGVGVCRGTGTCKGVSEGVCIGTGVKVGVCVGGIVIQGVGNDVVTGMIMRICMCMDVGGGEGLGMCLWLGMVSRLGSSVCVGADLGVVVCMDRGLSVGECVRMVKEVSLVVGADVGMGMGWSGRVVGLVGTESVEVGCAEGEQLEALIGGVDHILVPFVAG